MSIPDEDRLVERGAWGSIEYAVAADGSMPAKLFIDELSESELRKLSVLFKRLADEGQIRNREQFKQVEDKIFSFKRFQIRIGSFQEGRVWYLTHGFKKKGNKWPKAEVQRANRIRIEHLNRQGS